MSDITLNKDEIEMGDVSISFQRTLRIPDDGNVYQLPPGLGRFPIRRVSDFAGSVPEEWRDHGGVFIPMYQREAMWIRFSGKRVAPTALKVAVGKVNAISGDAWNEELQQEPQDYAVSPTQPWLDGINAGAGFIKQFVAMPLGMGYTVEGQVTGDESVGGIQILRYAGKPEELEKLRLEEEARPPSDGGITGLRYRGAPMGIAAGGKMAQKIYADKYGHDFWDLESGSRVFVHIVNSEMWRDITGEEVPATPVDVHAYTKAGLPWFDLYDDGLNDIDSSSTLESVKSVAEKDAEHGFVNQQDDSSVKVPNAQTHVIGKDKPNGIKDGEW